MKEIIVHTQKDFDKIKDSYKGNICIKDTVGDISINKSFIEANIYVSGNATIKYVSGNATIKSVSGNATIKYVSGNATIEYVYDNATIEYVYDNATIKYVYDNATIEYVYDNATIEYVSGNATILLIIGLACICFLYKAKKIVAKGMNMIRQIGTEKIDIEISKSVTFIQVKETIEKTPTFEMYQKLYPIEVTKKTALLYKAVHKIDGKYLSDYDKSFEYLIGETKEEKNDTSNTDSCSYGLHIAHKNWAVIFGRSWSDVAILECEVNIKDIVVSTDCDGKIRTSKLKVIRELLKTEY